MPRRGRARRAVLGPLLSPHCSFAFLQRRYPQVYDESLIPDRNGNHLIDYGELTGAAEEVA